MATQVSLNSGAVASAGALALQTNGTTAAITLDTSQNATFAGKVTSAGALTLASNGTSTAVTIDTSQNVGIGTSSPAQKLDVNGQATILQGAAYGWRITNSGGIRSGSNGVLQVSADTGNAYANSAISFDIDGSTYATIDSSGNLGLGVTPSGWSAPFKGIQLGTTASAFIVGRTDTNPQVQVGANMYYNGTNWVYTSATSLAASRYVQSAGSHIFYYSTAGTSGNTVAETQAMTLDASGNLLVGTTSSGGKITAAVANNASFQTAASFTNATNADFNVRIKTSVTDIGCSTATPLTFSIANTEAARIDSSGNLLVGTTSSAQGSGVGNKFVGTGAVWVVNAATNDAFSYYNSSASAYRFYVSSGGTISATNTTISAISDQRFKENIQALDAGLDKIMALKPRKFDWKEGKGKNIKGDRGFIAQEFEEVFPDLIDEWKDPAPEGEEPYKAVRADLIPVLVKAIQELKAEFDAYKASHP